MARNLEIYEDILEDRRSECSNYFWISRKLDPIVAYPQVNPLTPQSHKKEVLQHPYIQDLIEKLSEGNKLRRLQLELKVKNMLDEIGYNKNLKVIRWLGLVLVKICMRMYSGIYINKDSMLLTKSCFGSAPVVFVPSHRSYADFILMSMMCFTYDIAIPTIAAGTDFYGMWGMGSVLRDTGAFFMRRCYNDDSLYWKTFKQYIYQLVTKCELPMEFFIEGTRSRCNKSLNPKYGLLDMILKPFFLKEVPDIFFVPVNISYDRILEDKLFAFEVLGVPKPRESTSGFFKALSIIKDNYGSVHFTLGEPISAKAYFKKGLETLDSAHNVGPVHMGDLTDEEKKLIEPLGYDIIRAQQKLCVLYVFNLIAIIVNHYLVNNQLKNMNILSLMKDVGKLKKILEAFGAFIATEDLEDDIQNALQVHRNLIVLTTNTEIALRFEKVTFEGRGKKFKGHTIPDPRMTFYAPFVALYSYINPTMHYLADAAVIVVIMETAKTLTKRNLFLAFSELRELFDREFVSFGTRRREDFDESLEVLLKLEALKQDGKLITLGTNTFMRDILSDVLRPFLHTYLVVSTMLAQGICESCPIVMEVQRNIEKDIENHRGHPFSLNIDSIVNVLHHFTTNAIVIKITVCNNSFYKVNTDKVVECKMMLECLKCVSQKKDILSKIFHFKHKL